jgi:hypothetical protein
MNGAQLSALDETLNRARVDMEEVSCIVRRQSGSARQAATNLPKTLRAEAGRSTSVRADASSHPIGEATLLGDELERQVKAAGAHQLEQRLHARNDGASFPASDDGAVTTGTLAEFRARRYATGSFAERLTRLALAGALRSCLTRSTSAQTSSGSKRSRRNEHRAAQA